jgi:hypothetical protein
MRLGVIDLSSASEQLTGRPFSLEVIVYVPDEIDMTSLFLKCVEKEKVGRAGRILVRSWVVSIPSRRVVQRPCDLGEDSGSRLEIQRQFYSV